MRKNDSPISKLASKIKLFPQVLMNVEVEKRHDVRSVPEIEEAVRKAEKKLDGRGRVLVRASGTEPKIRVMLEGEDAKMIEVLGKEISRVIREKMK
jgi:phosphoglucosamine mutase